jgi:hypothetical protein
MKNMDRDVMGHDNATGPEPCANILGKTFGGKIRVIAPGTIGEANKELDPLVHRLATLTAKTPLGQMITPKTSRSGKGVEKVIRMRFRLILGVQCATANAEMKVMRSRMVGETPEEAMMFDVTYR